MPRKQARRMKPFMGWVRVRDDGSTVSLPGLVWPKRVNGCGFRIARVIVRELPPAKKARKAK